MRFKDFIREGAANKQLPELSPIEMAEGMQILVKHCSDALPLIKRGIAIWRGEADDRVLQPLMSGEHNFATVDTTATARKSENAQNHYTEIFDHHPTMIKMGFPKRSRSFICSTSYQRADEYATIGDSTPLAIIPFNGVPIGFVNKEDMWDIYIKLFGDSEDIEEYNTKFSCIGIDDTWDSFVKFNARFKDAMLDPDIRKEFDKQFPNADVNSINFLEDIIAAYDPSKTGMTVGTTAKWNTKKRDTEVWVGGKCLVLTADTFKEIQYEV